MSRVTRLVRRYTDGLQKQILLLIFPLCLIYGFCLLVNLKSLQNLTNLLPNIEDSNTLIYGISGILLLLTCYGLFEGYLYIYKISTEYENIEQFFNLIGVNPLNPLKGIRRQIKSRVFSFTLDIFLILFLSLILLLHIPQDTWYIPVLFPIVLLLAVRLAPFIPVNSTRFLTRITITSFLTAIGFVLQLIRVDFLLLLTTTLSHGLWLSVAVISITFLINR